MPYDPNSIAEPMSRISGQIANHILQTPQIRHRLQQEMLRNERQRQQSEIQNEERKRVNDATIKLRTAQEKKISDASARDAEVKGYQDEIGKKIHDLTLLVSSGQDITTGKAELNELLSKAGKVMTLEQFQKFTQTEQGAKAIQGATTISEAEKGSILMRRGIPPTESQAAVLSGREVPPKIQPQTSTTTGMDITRAVRDKASQVAKNYTYQVSTTDVAGNPRMQVRNAPISQSAEGKAAAIIDAMVNQGIRVPQAFSAAAEALPFANVRPVKQTPQIGVTPNQGRWNELLPSLGLTNSPALDSASRNLGFTNKYDGAVQSGGVEPKVTYPTATNPKTGQKLIFKDGQWQPL
jgi:hypothetical protein